jgi:phage-related protein
MQISNYGFTFNGQHSSEFGLKIMDNKQIGFPTKNKVTVQVPYSSGLVDLSNIYNNNSYSERTITFPCRIGVGTNQPQKMYANVSRVVNWLTNTTGKVKLTDDAMGRFYYLGEVQEAPVLTESSVYCDLNIVFTCYPFKFREVNYQDLWDPFDFENDISQICVFDVERRISINLYNQSVNAVKLLITANSDFEININGQGFSIKSGKNDNDSIKLNPGFNTISVAGKGHIEFNWIEEMI